MANIETTGGQSTLPGKKGSQSESAAEKSLAEFFNKMSQTLERIGSTHPKPPEGGDSKRFEIYSQAYQGFAQNNVSKTEGFSIDIKTDPKYDALTRELIKKKRGEGTQTFITEDAQ